MTGRKGYVYQQDEPAGILEELEDNRYRFRYLQAYRGNPVSLSMPLKVRTHMFEGFPTVFEGLLPEGVQLEALLSKLKIDRDDVFGQLLAVGEDTRGSLTIEELYH